MNTIKNQESFGCTGSVSSLCSTNVYMESNIKSRLETFLSILQIFKCTNTGCEQYQVLVIS